ncbi:MAG: putative MFS-type transporter YcaD [Chlamydiae bacterium]|nr:putative MFS-type transporter YcaD [Chlamydiota bacterium]
MFKLLKSILSPLLSLAIVMIAVGLFSTFVPLRLTLDGHSTFITGGVTAAYFAGLVLGSVRAERFIAQVGHIRTFSAFASLTGAISLGMGLMVSPALWILGRFLMGFFTAGLFIVIESWLLMVGGKERKGTILSFYMIAFYAAQAGGQFLLSAIAPLSLVPFSIGALFISLSVVPVALTKYKSPTIEEPSLLSPLKLLKISTFGILSSFGSGLIMGAFFGLAPVFAHEIGMNNSDVAVYMGVTIIGGFILQWPLGRLSDKINRRSVLIAVSFITSSLALLMAIASLVTTEILFVLSVLFGGFSFTMYPMSISYTNDYLDPKDLVAATGGLLVAYGVGSVIGPLIAPVSIYVIGPSGLYLYFSVIAALVGAIGLWRKNSRRPIPLNEQSSYRSIPRTTPKISELDPRAEDEVHLASQVESIEQSLQQKAGGIEAEKNETVIEDKLPEEPTESL